MDAQERETDPSTQQRIVQAFRYYAAPRNWPTLAGRVLRNPEFFADLLEYAGTDASKRRHALHRIVRHLYLRAFQGDALGWRSSTKGFARELLDSEPWLEQQLRYTPHFGALRQSGDEANRFDYAMLMNAHLLRFKQEFAGYGLGAKNAPECLLPSGGKLTLLEVAQAWSLLTNAGHLFGTFATERALLFELLSSPSELHELIECIAPPLQPHAQRLLRSGRLTHTYYALACWRISRLPMSEKSRGDCIHLLQAFLDYGTHERHPPHYWAFRAARQLAYHRMHLYLGVGHPVDAVHDDSSIRALSPWSSLGFEPQLVGESSLLAKMLNHVDAYQSENHFGGTFAAAEVLCHVRSFRRWWKNHGQDLPKAVDALFGRGPSDWHAVSKQELTHFCRVKMPDAPGSWHGEVDRWLNDNAAGAWTEANFLVTPQYEPGFICDMYVREGTKPRPLALLQASKQLARHCENSWTKKPDLSSRELWRSIGAFGLQGLALITNAGVRPILRPEHLRDEMDSSGHVAYALLTSESSTGIAHAQSLVARLENEDHRRELHATLRAAEATAKLHTGNPMLLFLGSVLLVEANQSQVERAEFDGVWCFFGSTFVTWYVLEHKRSTSSDRDLLKKLEYFDRDHVMRSIALDDVRGRYSVASLKYGDVT